MIDIDKYIHTIGRWFFVFFYTYQSILRMFDFSYSKTQGMNALIIWTSIIMIHVTAVSHHKKLILVSVIWRPLHFWALKAVFCLFVCLRRRARLYAAAAAAKSLQSYPTLCDPIDGGPPGSTVPGILQARTLEWIAISFSNAWKWKVKVNSLSRVRLFVTPRTAAYQAPGSSVHGIFQARVLEWVAIVFSSQTV